MVSAGVAQPKDHARNDARFVAFKLRSPWRHNEPQGQRRRKRKKGTVTEAGGGLTMQERTQKPSSHSRGSRNMVLPPPPEPVTREENFHNWLCKLSCPTESKKAYDDRYVTFWDRQSLSLLILFCLVLDYVVRDMSRPLGHCGFVSMTAICPSNKRVYFFSRELTRNGGQYGPLIAHVKKTCSSGPCHSPGRNSSKPWWVITLHGICELLRRCAVS
jgi:hypothetical protein